MSIFTIVAGSGGSATDGNGAVWSFGAMAGGPGEAIVQKGGTSIGQTASKIYINTALTNSAFLQASDGGWRGDAGGGNWFAVPVAAGGMPTAAPTRPPG